MKSENKEQVENLDPLAGVFNINKSRYKQKTEKEYDDYIRSLTNFELERHANSVGIIPSPRASKNILFERLRKKFSSDLLTFPVKTPEKDEIAKLSEEDEAELDKYFRRK